MAGGVALLCFAEVKELADFCLIHPKSQKREKKPGGLAPGGGLGAGCVAPPHSTDPQLLQCLTWSRWGN